MCFFCPNTSIDRHTQNIELEEEMYLKVLKELAEINYSYEMSFHRYNEPLANKELILKRIGQAREYLPNSCLVVFTNGDYLTKYYLDNLCLAGLNKMIISCYLDNNEDYDVENIVKPKMNKLLEKLSLDYEEITNNNCMYEVSIKYDNMHVVYRTQNFKEGVGSDRGGLLNNNNTYVRSTQCLLPFTDFNVDFNGNVMPCCNLRSDAKEHKNYILGNIKDNTIFEIFTNKKSSNLRSSLGINGDKMGACQNCDMGADQLVRF